MNKLNKLVEHKIRAEGWVKLLPTEKCETSQPHRFRYTDGKTTSVSIIQNGALAGVYQGPSWKERYKQVDWDTPECDCPNCAIIEGLEKTQKMAKAAAFFARQLDGVVDGTVDITNLQLERADNGYKQVTFYYKIDEEGSL
jgi:hypothetical protein